MTELTTSDRGGRVADYRAGPGGTAPVLAPVAGAGSLRSCGPSR